MNSQPSSVTAPSLDGMIAEAQVRERLRADPCNGDALFCLSAILSDRGDDLEAASLLEQAIYCQPAFTRSYLQLARLYYQMGRTRETVATYRAWRQQEPENPEAQHMAAAVAGKYIPERCTEAYIEQHFDQFSKTFDDVLMNRLDYRGPELVATELARFGGEAAAGLEVLDAGCGTGLCGERIRPWCRSLVGVDLSPQMLELAEGRGVYDALIRSDLCNYLRQQYSALDAIVSADVLIYFGALDEFIFLARQALRAEGLLIVTVEGLFDARTEPYKLQISGRYTHRESYLREELGRADLKLVDLRKVTIRYELGRSVEGFALTAQKARRDV